MSLARISDWFFYAWVATEVYVAIATRTRRGGGKVSDGGTLQLLWVVIFGSISAGIWISRVNGPNMPYRDTLRVAALVILIAGLLVRWTAIVSLGKSFSANVAVRETQTVYKKGLYRWVRHPSYTGLMLCFLATGLAQLNWISLLIILVFPMAALLYRIHVEEIVLRGAFGEEYVAYSRGTKRLIPGIF
jgi:protein-S-isoprenylcysteine O-methyltransferase Ste14